MEKGVVKKVDVRTLIPYTSGMEIRSVHHKGLRRLIEKNDERGIRRDLRDRIRKIVIVLICAADINGVQGPPGWRIHKLTGDRDGAWSVSVSGNWRITFDIDNNKIFNLIFEDYR